MAYASLGDVRGLNAVRTYSATSVPNLEDVDGYLAETAAVLDGLLAARGYVLPVPTGATSSLELLAHYNAIGAWSLVERAAASSPHKDAAAKAWESAQKMLRDGQIVPADLPKAGTAGRARGGGSPTPLFSRDVCL